MSTEVYLSIFIICGIYVVCELIGKAINYKVPTLVMFMLVLLVAGGQFGLIPTDIMQTSGFAGLTYSFGLPFVLMGFGTTMSLKSIKGEGMTVVTSLIAVAGIILLAVIGGVTFMGVRNGVYGGIEVAGGGQAGLIFLTFANEIGDQKLAAMILFLMNIQILVGYPACSWFMKKSMKSRIAEGRIPELPSSYSEEAKAEEKPEKKLINVPEWMQTIYYDYAVLALACYVSLKLVELTSLSQYVWYILIGFALAELGIIRHNVLAANGSASVLFAIMFVVVCGDFLEVKVTEMGSVVLFTVILLAFGVLGCMLGALISKRIFKVDFYEAVAIGLGCMVGYPPSQKVTEETIQGLRGEVQIDDGTALRLKAYYEPKIIIAGVVTISLLTGILAGIAISIIG